jgi:hypothetical protein
VRKSKSSTPPKRPATSTARPRDSAAAAREHYLREKARRAREQRPEHDLLAAAKREYLAMLEADAVKGKGGRPKKKAARPAADTEELNEEEPED